MDLSIAKIITLKGKVDYQFFVTQENSCGIKSLLQNFDLALLAQLTMSAASREQLQQVTYTLAYKLGFDHGAIAMAYPNSNREKFFCNHVFSRPNNWIPHYQKKLMFIDPFTNWCLTNAVPNIWFRNNADEFRMRSISPTMLDGISNFAIDNIVTIPCRGSRGEIGSLRLLNFSKKYQHKRDIYQLLPIALAGGTYLLDALNRLMKKHDQSKPHQVILTSREQEVLKWLSAGFSASDIGEKLHISENTVLTHTKKLYCKLQVNNRTQAVARAIALKILEI